MTLRDKSRATEKLEREVKQLGVVSAGKLRGKGGQLLVAGEPGTRISRFLQQNQSSETPHLSVAGGGKGLLSAAFATSIDGVAAVGERNRNLAKKRLIDEILIPAERGNPTVKKSRDPRDNGGAVTAPLPNTLSPLLATPQHVQPQPQQGMFLSKIAQDASNGRKGQQPRSKHLMPLPQESTTHSPAGFMHEITSYVESELQAVERRFPRVQSELDGRAPSTTLLPSEIAMRRAGFAPPTNEERRRAGRVGVFNNAQRMFADSFKTYKMFLDALAEENASYNQFLRDDLQLHKEVIGGMRAEIERVKAEALQQVTAANTEKDEALALVEDERERHKKLRMAHQQNQMKEKNAENDVRRQLLELEHNNQALREENRRQRLDIDQLNRQVETLSLSTFSDALESANHALQEWKAAAAAKEDAIFVAHDEAAELAKDLRRITEHFHGLILDLDQHLKVEDVKLSPMGLRTLFPEAAAARKRNQAADAKRQAKVVADRKRAELDKAKEATEPVPERADGSRQTTPRTGKSFSTAQSLGKFLSATEEGQV